MSWYDAKQAAVDPDNPAANEQIPFSEWNTMVTYLKDKIIDKAVNDAAIANNRVLVYKTATSTFVFEDQSAVAAINDLTDVVISGVPADNEVLAYDTVTSKWINQTAAEAALATTTDLASYLALAGGTMAGNLNMGDYQIDDVDDIQAYDIEGIAIKSNVGATNIILSSTGYAWIANEPGYMSTEKIVELADPTAAQDAATKNYVDTRIATKEIVTNFTDDYVFAYKTASGKFEMVAQSGAGGGVTDHGALTGLGDDDHTQYLLANGSRSMSGNLNMGSNTITSVPGLYGVNQVFAADSASDLNLVAHNTISRCPRLSLYGTTYTNPGDRGSFQFYCPGAGGASQILAMSVGGLTDTPPVYVYYGLNMLNSKITFLEDPTSAQDAATKNYVDTYAAGEANTASNQGTAGVGVYYQKVGVDIQFKNINAGSSKLTVTDDLTHHEIDIDINPANIKLDDLGTPGDNTDLNATTGLHGLLPKLGGGSTNFLRADGTWAAPPGAAGGETNTASNTGTTGIGVFKQKTGVDLELYKLNSVDNKLTIALNGTDRIDFTVNDGNFDSAAWLSLTDTPSSFAGNAGKIPRVNSVFSALEFKANAVSTTFVIAATTVNDCEDPFRADYQTDGTADQTEINTAITALPT